ncbi:MAG: response regulator [Ignavibacteriales bacterium]|nr:response regulator [Ignavibacteriales bacterium]
MIGGCVWENARLLVVEDDIDIANMLKIYFSGLDYDVDVAVRGSDALEKTKQVLPHLIVLDIMLPDIDGYEVCRTSAHEHAHQPYPGHLPDPKG